MAKLNNPQRKDFTKEDFIQHPIWTWDDDMDAKIPISGIEPSMYDFGTFFIKCEFTISNHNFDGYLIGSSSYYAIGLFVGGDEFVLNKNTPDLNSNTMKKISKIICCDSLPLYPIFYRSGIRFKEGAEISGILDFREKYKK